MIPQFGITTLLAYFLIVIYFVMERLLRQGDQALSLSATESDRGSTRRMLLGGAVEIIALLLAPWLNIDSFGVISASPAMGWVGIALMLMGLVIRFSAAKTLGEFYTRTLLISPNQAIVQQGLYRFVRHPGYLGVLLASLGAGLAVMNWVVLVMLGISKYISLSYRIATEESMLQQAFGTTYTDYANQTKRLVPWIF